MLGKIEGKRRRGQQTMRWLDSITNSPGYSEGQGSLACYSPWGRRVKLDLATEQQQTIPVIPCWVGIVQKLTVYWSRNIKPFFSVCTGVMPGKSHGRRSLVGCSPWGRQESGMTERHHFHFSLSCIGEGNGNPLQYSCLENPRDRGA